MDYKDNLIGQSSSFLSIIEHVSHVAPLNKPVLIVGERGTGKELIAERLHFLSSRWERSFLKLNCAAISDTLIESELFGHESGAFTGAIKRHQGRFELANKGTLFLDELATTSARIQEKLLRVIEYGEFERVGGNNTLNVDVRLIAATNEDLPALAEENKFRADLLDRLAFDVITLPPLRSRKEDIMILAESFAIKMTKELHREYFSGFTQQVTEQLLDYHWPGNVRELKNVVERNVYRHPSDEPISSLVLDPFESPFRPTSKYHSGNNRVSKAVENDSVFKEIEAFASPIERVSFPIDLKQKIQDFEIQLIESALAQSQFNQKKTADTLGLTYHQLRGYLKKYNLLEN